MRKFRTAILGAAASLALVGAVGAAYAQSQGTSQAAAQGRVIEVPPGAVVIVLPGAAMPMMPFSAASSVPVALAGPGADAMLPFAPIPGPVAAMMRQADQMMNQMMVSAQRTLAAPPWMAPDRTIEAAMRQMPLDGTVRGVVVTSFTDGHGTCTQRTTYTGDGAAPVVHVSSAGNACASMPITSPSVQPSPRLETPRTWQVDYRSHARRPVRLGMVRLGT